MPAAELAARRLTLSAAEFALLARLVGGVLPAGFEPDPVAAAGAGAAAAGLRRRGVLGEGGDPVAAVAANLAVLTNPTASVRTEVSVSGLGLRAVHAVSGPLGASLFALGGGGVELSLFPAVALGRELGRAVPALTGTIGDDLGGAFGALPAVTGRVPLTALAELGPVSALAGVMWAADRGARAEDAGAVGARVKGAGAVGAGVFSEAEAALARRVNKRARGSLWCLVLGRGGAQVGVGQVIWLAIDDDWVGLRLDPYARPLMVDLEVAGPGDLAGWLAPDLAVLLDSAP